MVQARIRQIFLLLIDIVIINFSYILSYLIRFDGQLPPHEFALYSTYAILITIFKLVIFYYFQLYNSIWKYASIDEIIKIFMAAIVSNALVVTYFFLFQLSLPRSMYILPLLIDIFLLTGVRFGYRFLRRLKQSLHFSNKDVKRVLVVGAGEAGSMVIQELKKHRELKSRPVALVDCDSTKQGRSIHGVTVLGKKEDIPSIVKEKNIQEIILAMPSASKKQIRETVFYCHQTDCKIKTLPGIFEIVGGRVSVNHIRDVEIEDLLGRDTIELDMKAITNCLEGKVVMVTGGGGSIGSELCRQIARFRPKKLLILDIYENSTYDLQQELKYHFPSLDICILIASVRDRLRLEQIFTQFKPHVIFHAAAHKHVPLMEDNPSEAIKNNVFGTLNVGECAVKWGVEKFVLISTDKAVNPTNIMGASKRVCEMIIQALDKASNTEFVAVRFGNVLGSNGSVIPLFKKQIALGGPVTVTHPEIERYFMTIPEAVQLVIQAGSMAKGGEIFVLDMGEPIKILDLAKNMIRLSGLQLDIDIKIEFTGLRPGEKLFEELLMLEEGLQKTQHQKIFIAQPLDINFQILKSELVLLKTVLYEDGEQIKNFISKLVPTYKRADLEKKNVS